MAYSHGRRWSEADICDEITKIVKSRKMNTMPTHSEMREWAGDKSLTNAVSKHGGTKYFASLLGLEIKNCESKFGNGYEELCITQVEEKLGMNAVNTKPRYPYDILVERAVKIDVKSGRLYESRLGTKFYTFNLEKSEQTCDIFVCYCIDSNGKIAKTLVIPSYVLSGKTQLSIGVSNSVYDKYIDAWHFIREYASFVWELV